MNRALSINLPLSLLQSISLEHFLSKTLIIALLCVLPLFFGGVHSGVYLAAYAITFFFAGTILARSNSDKNIPALMSTAILTLLVLLCMYLLLYGVIHLYLSQPHPILSSVPALFSAEQYFVSWFGITSAVAVIFITIRLLQCNDISQEFILRAISVSGLIVSLIALSHWFYDNGKLFWIFEPDHIFISERARWPFVSSNNLGHHLILTLYPCLFLLIRGIRTLFRTIDAIATRRPVNALDLINTPGVQIKLLKIVIDLFTLLSISLALLACQSRGSWVGSCVGVILFLWFDRIIHIKSAPAYEQGLEESLNDRKRKNRSFEGATFFDTFIFLVRKLSFLTGIVIAFVLLALFLRDRGLDLVTNRAEYGLLASKDDIRWVMYSNTMPMIYEHPLFGVGLGAWNIVIGRYIDPSLARLNPVYLHSDPLQFLAETGIIGCAFVVLAVIILLRSAIRVVFGSPNKDTQFILALLCGILALVISSFFDFPFRIPSISYLISIEVALLCFILDKNAGSFQTTPQ